MHKLDLSCHAKYLLFVLIFSFCQTIIANNFDPIIEFTPQVTATCKAGLMNIKVAFNFPYHGAVHARGHRNPNCMVLGDGSNATSLSINLYSKSSQPDYCGVVINNDPEQQRSVQLAIRVHRTLELADDKFYIITCGRTGIMRDVNSQVMMQLFENDRRVRETIYGHEYTIKTEIANTNGTSDIAVRNCFAFDQKNISIPLIDANGCPVNSNLITRFRLNSDGRSASATLKSMFKFPEGSAVHFQCDVIPCAESCSTNYDCNQLAVAGFGGSTKDGSRSLKESNEDKLLAATTVFVLDPAEGAAKLEGCDQSIRPSWLLWLAITLAVLFLIMLLMNIFLCTAMSCSCARTEIIEKEPSIIEEYDPYRSWHGSQYGSRYSLHGRDGHNKGYTSGGSTIHSNRSDRY